VGHTHVAGSLRGADITLAAWHQSEETKQSQTSRSFFGFDYSHHSDTHQRETRESLVTSVQSQTDVLSGAGQDTTLVGTHIVSATGEVRLQAGRHLTVLPAEDRLHEEHQSSSWDLVAGDTLSRHVDDIRGQEITTPSGALIAGRQVSLTSGADTHLVGARILGPEGVEVLAGGSLLIDAASQKASRYHEHRESGLSLSMVTTAGRPHWIGLNWNQQSTRTQADASAAHPAQLTSTAGNIALSSGGDLAVLGGQLAAAGDIVLAAGQRLILAGAMEGTSSQQRDESKTFIFHQRDGTDERWEQSHVVASQLQADGQIGLTAGEALQLGAVQITSGAATTLDAPDLQFLAEADTQTHSRTEWDTDRFYEVHKGQGRIEQTLTLAKIDARGGLNLPATARVAVQLDGRLAGQAEVPSSAAQLRDFARQLSAQPGLAYLADLAERPDVDWQALASAHEHWDYKTQGLTQEGAIVVAVAVAIVTYGAASTALGAAASTATTTTTTTATTAATTTAAGTVAASTITLSTATSSALAAGISSLASQAAVSFLNNGGNLGKTLRDLGSSQSVKNVVVAMLTAGLTNAQVFEVGGKTLSLNQIAGISSIPGAGSVAQGSWNTFGQNLLGVAGRGLVSAGVSTAIQGGSFGEALRDSVVGDLAAMGAGAVGSQWGSGPNKNVALQTLAHAGLGCAAASARDKDCAAGALGGAAESVLGNLVTLPTGENGGYSNGTRAFYTVGAMLAADVLSDAVGVDSLTAMDAARNAALNNYLRHDEYARYLRERQQCAARGDCAEVETRYRAISQANERDARTLIAAAQDCDDRCAAVLSQLRGLEYEFQVGLSFPKWGDSVHLGSQLNGAKLAAERQFTAAWCADNRAGCVAAVSSPAFIVLAVFAPAAAATALQSCLANPAGCTATFNSVVDGLLADGAVGAAGLGAAGAAARTLSKSGIGVGEMGIGPWGKGVTNVVDGTPFVQCGNGSCVSATAQVLTNGAVTEAQVLARIGEWADPLKLPGILNELAPGTRPWIGSYFDSAEDALKVANQGSMGAVLQAPGIGAHMVTISPIQESRGTFRVQDTGFGKTYDVTANWIRQFVSGGVWK
jgi:hypothetical protein